MRRSWGPDPGVNCSEPGEAPATPAPPKTINTSQNTVFRQVRNGRTELVLCAEAGERSRLLDRDISVAPRRMVDQFVDLDPNPVLNDHDFPPPQKHSVNVNIEVVPHGSIQLDD